MICLSSPRKFHPFYTPQEHTPKMGSPEGYTLTMEVLENGLPSKPGIPVGSAKVKNTLRSCAPCLWGYPIYGQCWCPKDCSIGCAWVEHRDQACDSGIRMDEWVFMIRFYRIWMDLALTTLLRYGIYMYLLHIVHWLHWPKTIKNSRTTLGTQVT